MVSLSSMSVSSLHLFTSSLLPFGSLHDSQRESHLSSVRLTPGHFLLVDAVSNGMVFSVPFSDCPRPVWTHS